MLNIHAYGMVIFIAPYLYGVSAVGKIKSKWIELCMSGVLL